jgi:hypothetical protein
MSRHSIGPDAAFEMLRAHSQRSGEKIVDVSVAVVNSHPLLGPSAP